MKKIYLIIIFIVGIHRVYSQIPKGRPLTLDEALKQASNDKKKYNYELRFDETLKPYIRVKFTNDLKDKKTITTLKVKYNYFIGEQGYTNDRIVSKIIKPGTIGVLKIIINKEELRSYRQPSDFKLDNLSVNTIRFSDGTLYKGFLMLEHQKIKN